MFSFLSLKILIYGILVAPLAPFLVKKRTQVLDHAAQVSVDKKSEVDVTDTNSVFKKGTIIKDITMSPNNIVERAIKNEPKNPTEVAAAVSKLEDLEKLLQVYPQNFIDHRETIKNQLQQNIEQNKKDYERLHQQLAKVDDTTPDSQNKIHQWMKIKRKEIDLYKEDLNLIDDISSIVTKLEAAKYISLNNINPQNYYNVPNESPSNSATTYNYPSQYDSSNWNYPSNNVEINYQQPTIYSPTYYSNEQTKYDIFNKVFSKYLTNYNGFPAKTSGWAPAYKRFLPNPSPNLSSSSSLKSDGFSQSPKSSANNKVHTTGNVPHYNIYYPHPLSNLNNVKTEDIPNAKLYSNTNTNAVAEQLKKAVSSAEDTEKAVVAINYLQEKLGLDTMSVLKLMSELKETTKNEMNTYKNQLQNNLLEYKRSSINKPSDLITKRSQIESKQKSFMESRDKFWLIKQVEWFITRLEAAKYAAMSKLIV